MKYPEEIVTFKAKVVFATKREGEVTLKDISDILRSGDCQIELVYDSLTTDSEPTIIILNNEKKRKKVLRVAKGKKKVS